MTALSLANIPSAINSYERLAFWVAQVLQDTSNLLKVNVLDNEPAVPVAQVQVAKIADGTDRAIVTLYIPINFDELNSTTAKTWMSALDITTAAPNAVYTSN
jgi:hypothetical protein